MGVIMSGMVTVEIQRNRAGANECEEAAFFTMEEAKQWANSMMQNYGYRHAWVNGIEYK